MTPRRRPDAPQRGTCKARVFSAEHLAAVCLQTGRAKDRARLLQLIEPGCSTASGSSFARAGYHALLLNGNPDRLHCQPTTHAP